MSSILITRYGLAVAHARDCRCHRRSAQASRRLSHSEPSSRPSSPTRHRYGRRRSPPWAELSRPATSVVLRWPVAT